MKKCPTCMRARAVVMLWRHRDGQLLTDGQFSDTVKVENAGDWMPAGYYCVSCARVIQQEEPPAKR